MSRDNYARGVDWLDGLGGEWPELIPLDAPSLPEMTTRLPVWAGDFADALSEATETPRELATSMVLAACATAAARRVRVLVHDGYTEPCNLWIACGLQPGNRKSAVEAAAKAPLLLWERDQAAGLESEIKRTKSEAATMQARAQALRKKAASAKDDMEARHYAEQAAEIEAETPEVPRPPQLWTSDATPERIGTLLAENGESLAWLSSEGGIFDILSGRYSGGALNLDLVLKTHDGGSDRVDRGSRPPVYLTYPLLTVGLSPQPEVLRGLARKPGFRGRGLLGRFLYLLPASPLGFRTLETTPIPAGVKEAYEAGIRAMLDWPPDFDPTGEDRPRLMKLSPAAHSQWMEFARYIESAMRPDGDFYDTTDWAGKAPGQAARVAGVLHAIEHPHPWTVEINDKTMGAALELMAVIARHSLAAFDLMGVDETIAASRRVWVWVSQRQSEGFSVRDVHQALKSTFPRVSDVREALGVLEERGYLRIIESTTTDGPGRPRSPMVRVRPDIAEGWR
jgi:hypothetical protein